MYMFTFTNASSVLDTMIISMSHAICVMKNEIKIVNFYNSSFLEFTMLMLTYCSLSSSDSIPVPVPVPRIYASLLLS